MQFPTLLQGWVSHFCAEGRGWVMCFLSTTFPNASAHPAPLYFLTSPLPRRNFYRLGLGYVSRTIECPLTATPKRQLGKNEVGSQLSAKVLMTSVRNISEIKEKNVFLISKIPRGKGEGYSSIKVMGGAHRKISRTPLKGTRILFYGRVQIHFQPQEVPIQQQQISGSNPQI